MDSELPPDTQTPDQLPLRPRNSPLEDRKRANMDDDFTPPSKRRRNMPLPNEAPSSIQKQAAAFRPKRRSPSTNDEFTGADLAPSQSQSQTSPKRQTRIRFDSEEPLPPPPADEPPAEFVGMPSSSSEDSDDDAPEAITITAAKASSKAATAGAARALEAKREKERARRKQLDTRLKQQASTSNTRRPYKVDNDEGEDFEAAKTRRLLPEELLTEDLFERSPTPQAETLMPDVKEASKKRLDVPRATQPKDVKIGPVKVRVLEKFNPHLPPRAEATRSKRENWLLGRRGLGRLSLEREQIRQPFFQR